jgi:hypothetical protein
MSTTAAATVALAAWTSLLFAAIVVFDNAAPAVERIARDVAIAQHSQCAPASQDVILGLPSSP